MRSIEDLRTELCMYAWLGPSYDSDKWIGLWRSKLQPIMYAHMKERMNEWMKEWMNERMHG